MSFHRVFRLLVEKKYQIDIIGINLAAQNSHILNIYKIYCRIIINLKLMTTMKKFTLNQIVTPKNNFISVQKHLSLSIKKVLFLLVFSFSFVTLSAQTGNSVTPEIKEIKTYISSLKTENKKMKVSVSNSQYVENLVFGIQPSIYYNSGVIKNYGDKPAKLFTDISSLNQISSANLLKDDVEIVVFTIKNTNDFNSKIDLMKLSGFNNLKYIYILSSVTTTEQNIANLFLNYTGQYSIFYKIEIAE
jgi:hypothetical protein